jgi:hypothetical protein
MSPKDIWLVGLLLLSCCAFLLAARWSGGIAGSRALVIYSVGFSIGFVILALISGLAVAR